MIADVIIPQVGESVTEATIGQWLKNDGDYVEMDEAICEIESEKATLELMSEQAGKLKILVAAGETVNVGSKIAQIDTNVKKEEFETFEEKIQEVEVLREDVEVKYSEIKDKYEQIKISPVAARILDKAGISYTNLKGTGQGGRITKSDAEEAVKSKVKTEPISEQMKEKQPVSIGDKPESIIAEAPSKPIGARIEQREKMSTLRKTIAQRLVAAKNETAMLTTFNEIDMSAIINLRKKYQDSFQKKYGIKLGFMSFFIKATCIALKEFPKVNASIDDEEIVFHNYCDISIAVSTPKGLVVPVIFNAELMSLSELETEVQRLADKARANKLTIDEMTGGTFSITNGGVFGSLLSTPIINPPQTAILGMHKIEERPFALNGEVVIRPMMYLALSYDHRIIDGKESVTFLIRLKELLENPSGMAFYV
jgi:2-oxoglutarate dehydrogenase E2 component (dihydrolipoamide succinyltransferase)